MHYQLTKIWMFHCFSCGESCLVIVLDQFVEEIDGFRRDKMLVFTVDESLPSLSRMPDESKGSLKSTESI